MRIEFFIGPKAKYLDSWILIAGLIAITLVTCKLASIGGFVPEAWIYPVGGPLDIAIDWASQTFRVLIRPISDLIKVLYKVLEEFALWLPWPFVILLVFIVSLKIGGVYLGLFCGISFLYMGGIGLWKPSLSTFVIIAVSVFFSVLVGIPTGILSARNDRVERIVRPILDTMQTMPIFVYLVPVIALFGIGTTPAIVATMIYSMPPVIRLTNLGIRQVPKEVVEASRSFGAASFQTLWKIQLPLARPSIMMGVNQTIMMALSMVIFVALIGSGGLGRTIWQAMQRLEVGRGLEAGIAVVLMAIILDRVSYKFTSFNPRSRSRKQPRTDISAKYFETPGLSTKISHIFRQCLSVGKECLINTISSLFSIVNLLWVNSTKVLKAHEYAVRNAGWLFGVLVLLVIFLFTAFVYEINEYPRSATFHFRKSVDHAASWMNIHLFFITEPIRTLMLTHALMPAKQFLMWIPWPVIIISSGLVSLKLCGWRVAIIALVGFSFIAITNLWVLTMDTLGQLLVALLITIVLAIPIGIFASQNNRFSALIRPVLDTMQTLPAFVYFPLIIFLFRLGEVSGVIITVMYAIAPAIRLTELGIREVSAQVMESARSYGSTPKQLLLKVQLPLARRSIMLGINQTTMMAFAMITYASLIGAPGLGLDILKHTGRAQLGSAAETGICLVFLAIFFDRITQALAKK